MEVLAYWTAAVAVLGTLSWLFARTDAAQRMAEKLGLGDEPQWRR